MSAFTTVAWAAGRVRMIDQTLLPQKLKYIECDTVESVAEAIRSLRVRGAPAIGVTAAFGLALCAYQSNAATTGELLGELRRARATLAATRPTAVNLFWALNKMMSRAMDLLTGTPGAMQSALLADAQQICDDDIAANRRMGRFGAEMLPQQVTNMTHCNAGALATAGYGTAPGVIRAAVESGRKVHVYVDETRPVLQGARLTAWELMQDGIPVTLVTDNMSAHLMATETVDCVIVGADRIAANGDVANKIGTYGLAVIANHHQVPLYVAAPVSTIDFAIRTGEAIPIEQRHPDEVTRICGNDIAPEGVVVFNPAFDVTPHTLVAAIITDRGVARPPYREQLQQLMTAQESAEVAVEQHSN